MAAAYVHIYCNRRIPENLVRVFGGNRSDVREVKERYEKMTKEEFLKVHPKFEDQCRNEFNLIVSYTSKNH